MVQSLLSQRGAGSYFIYLICFRADSKQNTRLFCRKDDMEGSDFFLACGGDFAIMKPYDFFDFIFFF